MFLRPFFVRDNGSSTAFSDSPGLFGFKCRQGFNGFFSLVYDMFSLLEEIRGVDSRPPLPVRTLLSPFLS